MLPKYILWAFNISFRCGNVCWCSFYSLFCIWKAVWKCSRRVRIYYASGEKKRSKLWGAYHVHRVRTELVYIEASRVAHKKLEAWGFRCLTQPVRLANQGGYLRGFKLLRIAFSVHGTLKLTAHICTCVYCWPLSLSRVVWEASGASLDCIRTMLVTRQVVKAHHWPDP